MQVGLGRKAELSLRMLPTYTMLGILHQLTSAGDLTCCFPSHQADGSDKRTVKAPANWSGHSDGLRFVFDLAIEAQLWSGQTEAIAGSKGHWLEDVLRTAALETAHSGSSDLAVSLRAQRGPEASSEVLILWTSSSTCACFIAHWGLSLVSELAASDGRWPSLSTLMELRKVLEAQAL